MLSGYAMKIILVLLDGLGDRAFKVLNHRTPLQSASTPNLDHLARLGSNGLFHASRPGQCLPSETAHFLLFGYDLKDFPGRGLLEAVGERALFEDRDVLCLAHLAQVSWERGEPVLVQKRPQLEDDELDALFLAISPCELGDVGFQLHRTRGNDGILIMRGGVSPFVSDSDPMIPGWPMARIGPVANNPEPSRSEKTAKALNAYLSRCYHVLTSHDVNQRRVARGLPPANFLATQRCGRRVIQEPFQEKWGMAGMVIASGAIYGGLARELGLTFVQVQDSPDPGEDLRGRIQMAIDDAAHDFIHVHTKMPDAAAHKGDPKHKEAVITALDMGLHGLVEAVTRRDDVIVAIAADHSTPSDAVLIHSGEPVPVALVGPHVRRDDVGTFDEISASKGCLGFLKGRELMLMLSNYANRSCLFGHQLGEQARPCYPKTYGPFKLTE
jgi:2,3-bisphosphoglycerate-independent phosphoglycerate mutase